MKIIPTLSIIFLLSACAPKEETFASIARMQGDEYSSVAEKWEDGRDLVEEGTSLLSEGKDMVREGEDNIEDGRNMIEKGKKMQQEAEAFYNKKK